MASFYIHGPTLTYVTDPALEIPAQQRVIAEFIRCAPDQMLRVAFRLPAASDDELRSLLEWYLHTVAIAGMERELLPSLVHNRPDVADSYSGTCLWMPARAIGADSPAEIYSVHNAHEALRAVASGASEVMFGHVFPSGSHPGIPGRGVEPLKDITVRVRRDINEPIVTAIGGINPHTVGQIGRARVFNVACIRAISRSPDIARTLEDIRHQWVRSLIDEDLNDPEPLAFGRMWGIWHRWEADSRM